MVEEVVEVDEEASVVELEISLEVEEAEDEAELLEFAAMTC